MARVKHIARPLVAFTETDARALIASLRDSEGALHPAAKAACDEAGTVDAEFKEAWVEKVS